MLFVGCGMFQPLRNDGVYDRLPADLKVCFDQLVPAPEASKSQMTSFEMFTLVAALKRSEMEKASCGKRLLEFIKTT